MMIYFNQQVYIICNLFLHLKIYIFNYIMLIMLINIETCVLFCCLKRYSKFINFIIY